MRPHQLFYWPFWLDSFAVSLVECFLQSFPGDSLISKLVYPSLDCVNYSAIFGAVYCMMVPPACIGSVSTLDDLYSDSSYRNIGAGVCNFRFCIGAGAGVVRFLGTFTLGYAVIMVGLLFMNYHLVCYVSLLFAFCEVVFCLKMSANFLISYILEAMMDTNRAVGGGCRWPLSYIMTQSLIFPDWILLEFYCGQENSTVFLMCSDWFLCM